MKDKIGFRYQQVFSDISIFSVSRLFPVELFILISHCIIWMSFYLPFLSLFFQLFRVPSIFITMCPLFSLLLSTFFSSQTLSFTACSFEIDFTFYPVRLTSCAFYNVCIVPNDTIPTKQFWCHVTPEVVVSRDTVQVVLHIAVSWIQSSLFRVSSGIACIHSQAFKGLF